MRYYYSYCIAELGKGRGISTDTKEEEDLEDRKENFKNFAFIPKH